MFKRNISRLDIIWGGTKLFGGYCSRIYPGLRACFPSFRKYIRRPD